MANLPLILQNLTNSDLFATTLADVTANGNLKTGRGKIVSLGAFFTTFPVFDSCRTLSVNIDGIQIIDKDSITNYLGYSETLNPIQFWQNGYFTKYNEGATFDAKISSPEILTGSVDFTPAPDAGVVYASYEGFSFFNKNYGKPYNSYNRQCFAVKFDGNESLTSTPIVINGILPKNRGKIIGFAITYGEQSSNLFGSWFTNGNCQPLNFSINGVNIIENMPATYFGGQSGAHKDFYFDEPIEGGQEFELSVLKLFTTSNGMLSVTFYFETK